MTNKNLICKDNRIVEASYKLTLKEQRIVLMSISQINSLEKLNENIIFIISASEYSCAFGMSEDAAIREMKAAIKLLYDRSIKVILDSGAVEDFRWISKKTTELPNKSVGLRFSQDIAPFLSNLKGRFTKYQFAHISDMKSVFSIRIYEMLMQWKVKRSVVISIAQFKDKLEISDKYPAFANVRQKVIEPAILEISKCSDIVANYEVLKTGKKITAVKLSFEYKNKDNAAIEISSEAKARLSKLKEALN